MKKLLLILALFTVGISLAACQSADGTRVFTTAELAQYDGANGSTAYVAVDGVVYDVTHAEGWTNGYHQGMHLAGTDATAAFAASPHSQSTLDGLPVVGTLSN